MIDHDPASTEEPELASILERLAFDAWRAAEVESQDGWRLRFNQGVTRRAGSVWPNEALGHPSLSARIDRAEAFYRQRGEAPLFQVSPAARPSSLDAALEDRGYSSEAPVTVQIADSALVAAAVEPHRADFELAETLTESWFSVPNRGGRFRGADNLVYRSLLRRAGEQPCFALARVDGAPASVGLGVAQAGWVGVFAMLTLPEHRGRGLGSLVLGGLAGWAADRGEERLYLQVECDNPTAQRLYQHLGFTACYGYHYRRAPRLLHPEGTRPT